jgi:hypothetical protein
MLGKMARSAPRPTFGLPEALLVVCTPRLSCRKAGKARIFKLVRESSGESRLKPISNRDADELSRAVRNPPRVGSSAGFAFTSTLFVGGAPE